MVGNITLKQAEAIIRRAPKEFDGLSNWGTTVQEALRRAIPNYAVRQENILQRLHCLANDFYGPDIKAFNEAIRDVLGFDSVVKHYDDKTHYVAFFPDQIEIIEDSARAARTVASRKAVSHIGANK